LRGKLGGAGYAATAPSTEDWGWYIDVEANGASYLVGASGEPERPAPDIDWTIQIDRIRSLKDKLTGRNKMTNDDPMTTLLETFLRNEPGIRDLSVDRNA